MNAQTHLMIGAALFGRRLPRYAWAGALGGVLPDLPSLLIATVLKAFGVWTIAITGLLYWQEWWQIINAVAHNFWLWGGLLAAAVWLRERPSLSVAAIDRWAAIIVFAAAGFLHVTIDFLLHRDEAHMSFWPLTRWKFVSPVSYHDPQHFGTVFQALEAGLIVALAILLASRYKSPRVRVGLLAAVAWYAFAPSHYGLG